jgi:hypothetical protein
VEGAYKLRENRSFYDSDERRESQADVLDTQSEKQQVVVIRTPSSGTIEVDPAIP